MRRIAKPILVIIAVFTVVYTLLTAALNLYLHLPGKKEALRGALSSFLRMPVSLDSVFWVPSGGIRFNGVLLGNPPRDGKMPRFSASAVTLYLDYPKLLRGMISLGKIRIVHPRMQYSLVKPPAAGVMAPVSSAQLPRSSTISPDVLQGVISPKIPSNPSPPDMHSAESMQTGTFQLSGELPKISISQGEFLLKDDHGTRIVYLNGVDLVGEGNGSWNGLIRIHRAVIGKGLTIREIHSELTLSGSRDELLFKELTAQIGGGQLRGSVTLNPLQKLLPYSATLKLSGASLKELLEDLSYGPSSAEGSVTGELTLSGSAGAPSSMEGSGSLLGKEAVIEPADFLKQIGQLLQIDELQLLRLTEAKSLFRIVRGNMVIDDLLLRSRNIILRAKGPVRPTGELDLEARLLLNEKLTGRLRGILGPQLGQAPEPGYSQVLFHISGDSSHPKTDLLERLTGIRIGGDLGGLLQGIFGHPSPRTPVPQPATPSTPSTNR